MKPVIRPPPVFRETWETRKAARKANYERFVKGWKMAACSACSGSGRYDAAGSPACGACGGSGKVRVSPKALKSGTVAPIDPPSPGVLVHPEDVRMAGK